MVNGVITKFWEEEVTIQKGIKKEKSTQKFIQTAVSGLKEDRDNERMSQEAIDDMIMQFRSATIPFFPDHGFQSGQQNVYSWKQMMGVWVDAEQEDDKLMATLRLNKAHPDTEMFWDFVQEGMPLAFSIGGKPVDAPTIIEEDIKPEVNKALTTEKVKGEEDGEEKED